MSLKSYIKSLRSFRVLHRYVGVSLALFLFISAVTGVLLALKKEVNVIQPATQKGVSKDLSLWKPLNELSEIAEQALHRAHKDQIGNGVDRLDVRPDKGMVKILFEQKQWEVQLDGQTGAVLSIARRHSDWIEALHDGSIISHLFKLISMNFLGIGLVFLLLSGLWLWYGPKRFRLLRKRRSHSEKKD